MDKEQRLKKIVNWLIYQGVAENEKALSELLGYTKSSFSQIMNGRVPLSDKFLDKLCSLDENINKVWILTGEGNQFITAETSQLISENDITIPAGVWRVIKLQAESLSSRDKQIDKLIQMLKDQISKSVTIIQE